jgi:hypothetical protein
MSINEEKEKTKEMTLHFWICGEGLMRLIQETKKWNKDKARAMIDCLDIPLKARMELFDGKISLENKGQELILVNKPYNDDNEEIHDEKSNKEEDFSTITNAWISPEGKIIPCAFYGHIQSAYEIIQKMGLMHITNEQAYLQEKGWIKLSELQVYLPYIEITQHQIDVLFDFISTTNKSLFYDKKHYDQSNFNEFIAIMEKKRQ